MREIVAHYCEPSAEHKQVARFLSIYIEEAHAVDEWWLWDAPEAREGQKRCIYSHKNIDERLKTAIKMQKDVDFPGEIICDSMEGHVDDRYNAWPERLYIIDANGIVVYKGGEGPFGYKLAEVQDWLADKYGRRGTPIELR